MRHEISVELDLDIRDGQLFKEKFYFLFLLKVKFLFSTGSNIFISESFHLHIREKIKFKIQTNAGGVFFASFVDIFYQSC